MRPLFIILIMLLFTGILMAVFISSISSLSEQMGEFERTVGAIFNFENSENKADEYHVGSIEYKVTSAPPIIDVNSPHYSARFDFRKNTVFDGVTAVYHQDFSNSAMSAGIVFFPDILLYQKNIIFYPTHIAIVQSEFEVSLTSANRNWNEEAENKYNDGKVTVHVVSGTPTVSTNRISVNGNSLVIVSKKGSPISSLKPSAFTDLGLLKEPISARAWVKQMGFTTGYSVRVDAFSKSVYATAVKAGEYAELSETGWIIRASGDISFNGIGPFFKSSVARFTHYGNPTLSNSFLISTNYRGYNAPVYAIYGSTPTGSLSAHAGLADSRVILAREGDNFFISYWGKATQTGTRVLFSGRVTAVLQPDKIVRYSYSKMEVDSPVYGSGGNTITNAGAAYRNIKNVEHQVYRRQGTIWKLLSATGGYDYSSGNGFAVEWNDGVKYLHKNVYHKLTGTWSNADPSSAYYEDVDVNGNFYVIVAHNWMDPNSNARTGDTAQAGFMEIFDYSDKDAAYNSVKTISEMTMGLPNKGSEKNLKEEPQYEDQTKISYAGSVIDTSVDNWEQFSPPETDKPPTYYNLKVDPTSPADYAHRDYGFTSTWIDDNGIAEVILEFNKTNYTAFLEFNVYKAVLKNIEPGNYTYRWYGKDTGGNWNTSEKENYLIDLSEPRVSVVKLLVNGVEESATIEYGSTINITAFESNGREVTVETNFTGTTSKLVESSKYATKILRADDIDSGTYNITAFTKTDLSFNSSTLTRFLVIKPKKVTTQTTTVTHTTAQTQETTQIQTQTTTQKERTTTSTISFSILFEAIVAIILGVIVILIFIKK